MTVFSFTLTLLYLMGTWAAARTMSPSRMELMLEELALGSPSLLNSFETIIVYYYTLLFFSASIDWPL